MIQDIAVYSIIALTLIYLIFTLKGTRKKTPPKRHCRSACAHCDISHNKE